jgi:dUTP pyrophosphatase
MEIKLLHQNATLPTRNNKTDAGLDIYTDQDIFIEQGTTTLITTGIAIKLPKGTYGKIEDRSSMASKGLKTAGGVIDEGYRGEIKIVMNNLTNKSEWHAELKKYGYRVHKGDKIAQLIIANYKAPSIQNVKEFSKDGFFSKIRGNNGFGSSGR